MHRTPLQRLADVLLGRPVEEYVAELRAAGRPWRQIARDLEDATGGQVAVTEVTLRTWCGTDDAVPAAAG